MTVDDVRTIENMFHAWQADDEASWRWRWSVVEYLARQTDSKKYGVAGFYLIGSIASQSHILVKLDNALLKWVVNDA